MPKFALDTNILAYAEGVGDAQRCGRAIEVIEQISFEDGFIPIQVLGELHRVLVGKVGRPPESVRAGLQGWAESYPVGDSNWNSMLSAFDLATAHQLQIWDALILSVASQNQCRYLLTEDMHDGFIWHGVSVLNPFTNPLP